MHKPKILHISSPGYKSAGKLAFDIHEAFMRYGCESFMVCKDNNYGFKNSFSYYGSIFHYYEKYKNRFLVYLKKLWGKKPDQDSKYGYHYTDHDTMQFQYRNILKKTPFKPDIIILYALHEFINAKTIKRLEEESKAKIFWLFYDMGPMTGGCHYSWNCESYAKMCGTCPWLFSQEKYDSSYKNMLLKTKYLKDMDIITLICSEWLMRKVRISSLFSTKNIHKWMMPVDLTVFKPAQDKSSVKKELGLDPEKIYILFGSVNLENSRKGSEYVIKALGLLKNTVADLSDFEVIIPGYGGSGLKELIKFKIILPGFIYDRATLIKYYQAAHVAVVPSVEDTGPLMISEAMACGTPVVSFEMGSAYDLVYTGITGYRAELKCAEDLSEGISSIINLSTEKYNEMSANCRRVSEEKIHIDDQVNYIVDIFNKMN
jgi:glycosyltransferase involved in cell wall biosynthesis